MRSTMATDHVRGRSPTRSAARPSMVRRAGRIRGAVPVWWPADGMHSGGYCEEPRAFGYDYDMGIGVGIFLIVVGAILTFAVHATVAGLDPHARRRGRADPLLVLL